MGEISHHTKAPISPRTHSGKQQGSAHKLDAQRIVCHWLRGPLRSSGQHLRQVGDVVSNVLAEGIRQVLGQALNGLGAGDQSLHGEAHEGNLPKRRGIRTSRVGIERARINFTDKRPTAQQERATHKITKETDT